ncbi:hypothetical protein DB30_01002 [Enhygromyxa salina]|uniref:Uncharacterized protein n=1 Tax=Enhygromyxa salina TaxID=215803 RepID=A0A0C1Z5B4_9BACT|nr:hypothetical protein [Enhygromyxa salina]KIG12794.1 hypothetical protein DB30_01002 [Enhygromyxa salina]
MDTAIPASSALPTTDTEVPVYDVRGRYQDPNATMTLREGLAEYYRVNPGLSIPANLTNEVGAKYFHCHDCTHVVFGTHTGPLDEGVNDMLTMMGVSVSVRRYLVDFFQTGEVEAVAKGYTVGSVGKLLFQTMRVMPTVWRRTRAMTKKWPWSPPEALLDRPLNELRAEYGISVFRPNELLGLSG